MFTKEPFDLVLMDVQMPEMDGLDATRSIRRHQEMTGGHVPIVALTAHAMKGDRQRCLSAGMDAYVTKPIRSKELLRVITEVTAKSFEELSADQSQQPACGVADEEAALEGASTNGSLPAESNGINLQAALEALDGNRQLLGELVAIFREECPKLQTEIETALACGDLPSLRRAAHTLKSSLAHLAAGRARTTAEAMETNARQQNLQGAGELWPRLQAELEELWPLLDEARSPARTSGSG